MLDELLNKIKNNRLSELTKEEFLEIENNELLFQELVNTFSSIGFLIYENMSEELLSRLFVQPLLFNKILDYLEKTNGLEDVIETLYGDEYKYLVEISNNNAEFIKVLNAEKRNRMESSINYLFEHPDNHVTLIDEDIINYIIEHSYYELAGLIEVENPNEVLENFIIEACNRGVISRLNTISTRIKEYCINTSKISLILPLLDYRNPYDKDLIINLLERDLIKVEDLPWRAKSDANPIIIKKLLLADEFINKEQETIIRNNSELIDTIIDIIKTTEGDLSFTIKKFDYIPEVMMALIRYNKGNDFNWLSSTFEYYMQAKPEKLEKIYENNHELFLNNVLDFFKDNIEIREKIIIKIIETKMFKNDWKLFLNILSDVEIKELFEYFLKNNEYNIYDNELQFLIEYIAAREITDIKLTSNFSFNNVSNIPAKILASLIKIVNTDELNKLYIYSLTITYDDPDLYEIVKVLMDRIIREKNTHFNYDISVLLRYMNEDTIKRITSFDNPLNLNLSQISQLLGRDFADLEEIKEYIMHSKINSSDFSLFVLPKINENNIEVLSSILSNDCVEFNLNLVSDLITFLSKIKDSDKYNEIYNIIKSYLLKHDNIPLKLTAYFDEETILKSTLGNINDEMFVDDFSLLMLDTQNQVNLELAKKVLFKKIVERLNQGKDVSFILFHMAMPNDLTEEEAKKFANMPNLKFLSDDRIYKIFANGFKFESVFIKRFIDVLEVDDFNSNLFIIGFNEYENYFLNRIIELLNTSTDLFGANVLFLLKNSSNNVEEVISKLVDNDRIDFYSMNEHHLKIKSHIIDKIILEKIIPNPTMLNKHLVSILNRDSKYESEIAKALLLDDNNQYDLYKCVFDNISKFPLLEEAIIRAIKMGKMNISRYQYTPAVFRKSIIKALLEYDESLISGIIEYLVHNSNKIDLNEETFDVLVKYIARKYQNVDNNKIIDKTKSVLVEKNLKYLYSTYGNTIIPLLENDNFEYLCTIDTEYVKRFIQIVKPRALDKRTIEDIGHSLNQNVFAINNTDILTIYTTIMASIQNGTINEFQDEYIEMLKDFIPDNMEEVILDTGDKVLFYLYNSEQKAFLEYLFESIKHNQNTYANVLNTITNNYIILKRNEYDAKFDLFKDTNTPYFYDKKSLWDSLFNELLVGEVDLLIQILDISTNNESYDLDINTLSFLQGELNIADLSKESLTEIKKNIGVLKKKYYEYMQKTTFLPNRINRIMNSSNVTKRAKRILNIPVRNLELNSIFKNVNIKNLLDLVIIDDEKYTALLEIIDKYKILDWYDIFEPLISKLSIDSSNLDMYSFINCFSQIYDSEKRHYEKVVLPNLLKEIEKMKEKGASKEEMDKYFRANSQIRLSGYKILKYTTLYSSLANCYKLILGLEDFNLIRKNQGPNASNAPEEERLQRACEVHLKAIQNDKITIPSFITDIDAADKKMQVIVGNRAHPRNVSHGERTGACMRALGFADKNKEEDLFEFCACNTNGFHISFLDSETGEYVSRVSGFRNGNTVFLNQLRYSVSDKFTDSDVVSVMKEIANILIEKSKDSTMPIENVVASPYYALYDVQTQKLSQSNIGVGVYEGYKDVSSNAVVLATTGENGIAVPLKLDTRMPLYDTVRIMPIEITKENIDDEVKISMQRISALKLCLENKDDMDYYKRFDIDVYALESLYEYVIMGQDWFVALNSDMEIISDYIPFDNRYLEEFNAALEKIENIRESLKMGGVLNV